LVQEILIAVHFTQFISVGIYLLLLVISVSHALLPYFHLEHVIIFKYELIVSMVQGVP